MDTSLLALSEVSVNFWTYFAFSLLILSISSSFSQLICFIVSRCSLSSLSIFFMMSFFLSFWFLIFSWQSSYSFLNYLSFSLWYLTISFWKSLAYSSCARLSSSYFALSCITFLAWLESYCCRPFSNYSFFVLISQSNFFLMRFFFSRIELYLWLNCVSSEEYLSFSCFTWSSLTGPEPLPDFNSVSSCFKFYISAFRVSRSFLVISISLETGRTSFNLSDRASLSLI